VFVELVVANKTSLARATPYFMDKFQHQAYGTGGYAGYQELTKNLREHAIDILVAEPNGVATKWVCQAKCCANKQRWCGKRDKFGQHCKSNHNGADASWIPTVIRTKNGTKLGYCSLCPSAPVTLMPATAMKVHLAQANIHVQ